MAFGKLKKIWIFLVTNWLALSMMAGIILGFILGALLKKVGKYANRHLVFIGFLGEMFLRMLKGIAVPLTMTCLLEAFTTLDAKLAKLFGLELTLLIIATKFIAIPFALGMVIICRPGNPGANLKSGHSHAIPATNRETLDHIFDMINDMIPRNIISMFVLKTETNVIKEGGEIVGVDNVVTYSPNMLGIVSVSIICGIALKTLGDRSEPIANLAIYMCEISFNLVNFIMFIVPVLLISLVAEEVLKTDFSVFFSHIGLFALVTCSTMLLYLLIILPFIVLILGRTNPYRLYWHYIDALATAFASSSTLACMPIAIEILEEHFDPHMTNLIVPVSLSINKDGSAINLAVEAIFFAQCVEKDMTIASYLLVAVFCLFLSVAAPGVPEGVFLMLLVILGSLEIPTSFASTILAVDILVDRVVTTLNVADAAAAVCIIDNLTRKKREQIIYMKEEEKRSREFVDNNNDNKN